LIFIVKSALTINMISSLKKLVPQEAINLGKHFPLSVYANLKYGFPSRGMKVIGVTGTDGKTTTSNMIYQVLREAGKKAALVSTINAVIDGKELDTGFHVTTPNQLNLQSYINQAKLKGTEYLVLEVTSHALDQYRVWGVKFDIGVVTNITHEHLDYHKTWENYFQAKFKLVKNSKKLVLNMDDKSYPKIKGLVNKPITTFGMTDKSDLNPKVFPFKLKVPGDFNIQNALAASAVGEIIGIDKKIIKNALENFQGLRGRMDLVPNKRDLKIVIDFAHTPNGLEQALKALKKTYRGKITALIGAEGYRDEGKRSQLGKIAVTLADRVIITSVDPRGLLEKINKQILEGVKQAGGVLGKNVFVEDDREKAIDMAINDLSKKGDIVGIFGKGHETSNNLDGKKELPWSDYEAVEKALRKKDASAKSRTKN
jgi:UDP-N-acetylmuramoyl-L-alanyl-D-glutamate--2,6-diaminopimelate ligase